MRQPEPAKPEWTQDELRIAILHVLLAARKRKPHGGGADAKMLMATLHVSIIELDLAMVYMRERSYIQSDNRVFVITGIGMDYMSQQLKSNEYSSFKMDENGRLDQFLGQWQLEPPRSDWTQDELRIAILQVLLVARKRKPSTGGANGKMLMDCLELPMDSFVDLEFALWYLREKSYIELGERVFMITVAGMDYMSQQLAIYENAAAQTFEVGRLFQFMRQYLTTPWRDASKESDLHQDQEGLADLHMPVLQLLMDARKNEPHRGGVSEKRLIDWFQLKSIQELDWELWYLKEKKFLEIGRGEYMITEAGIDYLNEQRARPVDWIDSDPDPI